MPAKSLDKAQAPRKLIPFEVIYYLGRANLASLLDYKKLRGRDFRGGYLSQISTPTILSEWLFIPMHLKQVPKG